MSAEDVVAHAVAEKYAFVDDTVAVMCAEGEPLRAVPLTVRVACGVGREAEGVGEVVRTLDFVALCDADLVPPSIVIDGMRGVADGVYGCVDAIAVGVPDITFVTVGADDCVTDKVLVPPVPVGDTLLVMVAMRIDADGELDPVFDPLIVDEANVDFEMREVDEIVRERRGVAVPLMVQETVVVCETDDDPDSVISEDTDVMSVVSADGEVLGDVEVVEE